MKWAGKAISLFPVVSPQHLDVNRVKLSTQPA